MSKVRKRLFFALWPDELTRETIVQRTADIVRRAGGRSVRRPNLHVTLAFLHNVDIELLPCIADAARRAATTTFSIVLTRAGTWPRSSILWLAPDPGHDETSGAGHLADRLWAELAGCGLVPERRRFRPHVTLARKVCAGVQEMAIEPIIWRVREFALMESTDAGSHPRYQVLQTYAQRNR